ncbi:MAG: N-acetylmuramoyl-L-alanine amidase [Candidatus Eisenbacteria bacterium]|uniref:N-acetylmuramoyl-L-alanine amidase n=1 Tax=Eiseniibacteriota bacterium TaxID=2212470 RepID=A0A948RVW2_UNCEI|nr:N-acetylmuramoyl-L-alanine amidase [Candidatus Eisenbacteria bacterium]MBU1947291.1 N-acetylmuramoyl-L-alanine amidase [Candidatus Eisenbacteria bacterium]MBU2691830.1 N-acetylmuramoyl-L-alanine amidase [Candidatus Eisenbacteria bacterium]
MRRLIRLSLILQIVLCGAGHAVLNVEQIRTGVTEGRVRVVIDLSEAPKYRIWTPDDPHRIAINIANSVFNNNVKPIALDDDLVQRIRLNSLSGPKAQIVLDLSREARFEVFTLPPEGGKGYRLVCDVYRSGKGTLPVGRPWIVVLDPGHGGQDPGATTREGDRESEIVLDVAKRVKSLLDAKSGIKTYLTRDKNHAMGLRSRIQKAQDVEADVFISIHVNAAKARQAHGVEVFFLSLKGATDEASRELALLENQADYEIDAPIDESVRDLPFSFDLIQSDTILRSSLLAESLLKSVEAEGLAASRGVKQARFVVLKSYHIPSALVELGFISNSSDCHRLRQPSHRQLLAKTLFDGIIGYHEKYAPQRVD